MQEEDDAELVGRCLAGDTDAFGPLVERYQRLLYGVALRMLDDPEDARDAAQTTFVRVYEKLDGYDSRYRFFSWIYRILLNECLNRRRAGRRRREQPLAAEPAVSSGLQEQVEMRERERHVRGALMQLSDEHRAVVVLRHFGELSYRELSDTLQIPETLVKSRLYEARQRLGVLLAGAP